jgi:hypothetical protein
VLNGSLELTPRNLSQDDFCEMDTAHMAIALGHSHWSQRHHANAVIYPITGKEMDYSALMKDPHLQPLWTRGFGNECGRLFQGIKDIPGTDTFFFATLKNIPKDRKITYGKIVCDYKPHKQEKERVRLTIGGDTLDYDKLLLLPQPPVRARTDTRTNPSAQRATQLRRVLARVKAVSIQNQITTTVP